MPLGHLRRAPSRALALVLGVVVAATGFTVLTGTARASQLQVVGTADANARSAYNILIRPAGSRTGVEQSNGLVRGDFLSGIFGEIKLDQYAKVKALPGVQVAAPVEMSVTSKPTATAGSTWTRFRAGSPAPRATAQVSPGTVRRRAAGTA